jgi:hypothetical protein
LEPGVPPLVVPGVAGHSDRPYNLAASALSGSGDDGVDISASLGAELRRPHNVAVDVC